MSQASAISYYVSSYRSLGYAMIVLRPTSRVRQLSFAIKVARPAAGAHSR